MVQHVDKLTHDKDHLLYLLVTVEGSSLASNVDVIAVGFSDHHLVVADLSVERSRPAVVTYSYRDNKKLDRSLFVDRILATNIYCDPVAGNVDNVDEYANRLENTLIGVLDEFAPLKTRTKQRGNRAHRWLSDDAVHAKRVRRRLERRWKKTRCDEDRAVYRGACHAANSAIKRSRESFHQQRLQAAAGDHRTQ